MSLRHLHQIKRFQPTSIETKQASSSQQKLRSLMLQNFVCIWTLSVAVANELAPSAIKSALKSQKKLEEDDVIMKRKQYHMTKHYEEGIPIPLELNRTWDRWRFHFKRAITSQCEHDPDTEPIAMLYLSNRNIVNPPPPKEMKLTMTRGASTGSIRNPYPAISGFNYSLSLMHRQRQNNAIIPIKDFWFSIQPKWYDPKKKRSTSTLSELSVKASVHGPISKRHTI